MGLNNFSGNNNGNTPPNSGGGMPGGGLQSLMGGQTIDPMELVIDYNQKFKTGGNALFRDELVQQTLSVLIGKNKPNALLIGAAGVGKTKIVEDIAFRLANDDHLIPDKIKGHVIYELPLSNIVAGSQFVGQVEEKIKAVIEYMTDPANKAILFIDEIHMLCGDTQTYEKIAQILKPALGRGSMRVIGATTLQESNALASDPAFNRRFSRLIVDELTREQTIEILEKTKSGFFTHYNNKITIDDTILSTIAIIADQYKTAGSHRPDTAITLLDRTIGDAIVNRKVVEQRAQGNPAALQAIQAVPLIDITEKQVKKTAMKIMTGNSKRDSINKDQLTLHLSTVKGQDNILSDLIDGLCKRESPYFPQNTPLTWLFTGKSGVGKTEVSRIIADELTGLEPITLNMAEFHSPASINRIIGSPAGYIGSDSNAELPFDCLESNPYQIILLDEFEKCDNAVQRLFMSAFEDGYITTSRGKIVDFSKSIIIATTNAGHSKGSSNPLGFATNKDNNRPNKEITIKMLSQWFDTELLNRFNGIFTFNPLTKSDYRDIIADIYKKEITRIKSESRNVKLPDDIPDDDLDELTENTFVSDFGARPAKKTVRNYILDRI